MYRDYGRDFSADSGLWIRVHRSKLPTLVFFGSRLVSGCRDTGLVQFTDDFETIAVFGSRHDFAYTCKDWSFGFFCMVLFWFGVNCC